MSSGRVWLLSVLLACVLFWLVVIAAVFDLGAFA